MKVHAHSHAARKFHGFDVVGGDVLAALVGHVKRYRVFRGIHIPRHDHRPERRTWRNDVAKARDSMASAK